MDKRGAVAGFTGLDFSWTELRQYGNSHSNVQFSSDNKACTSLFTLGVLALTTGTADFLLRKVYGESFFKTFLIL